MKGLVAIVVPSYNYNILTASLIRSVSSQSYRSWQLIVVDDCSTDATQDILKDFIQYDERIQIILKDRNEGMAATLNQGFALASGEFIVGMNADDCLAEAWALERMVAFLEENPTVGLVYTDNWIIDRSGNKIGHFRKPTRSGTDLLEGNFIATWSCMWRRSVFEKVGFRVDYDMCCDWDLWLRLSEHCEVAHLAEPLFGWYRHPDSLYFQRRRAGTVQELECLLNARRRRGFSNWSLKQFYLSARLLLAKTSLQFHGLDTLTRAQG